ncbi:hypothetical protein BRC68_02050 [Halobacteriales archaeon QH_6_64_20]|nr:MAG: hypothetical protein BRC68_02050 [Halobacteriales archaeon QH_6_64_20]
MITGVHQVGQVVEDFERALGLYEDVLGATVFERRDVEAENDTDPAVRMALTRAPDCEAHLRCWTRCSPSRRTTSLTPFRTFARRFPVWSVSDSGCTTPSRFRGSAPTSGPSLIRGRCPKFLLNSSN